MKNRSSYAVLTRFGIIAAILATLVLIAPAVSAADPLEYDYPENGDIPVETFIASDEDADAGDIEWSLEGVDAGIFKISDEGVLTFDKSPSFETAKDANEDPASSIAVGKGDNVYKVTVVASGTKQAVEVTVTDVEEEGEVTFDKPQPQSTRGLIAEVGDPDGGVTKQEWQWSRCTSDDNPGRLYGHRGSDGRGRGVRSWQTKGCTCARRSPTPTGAGLGRRPRKLRTTWWRRGRFRTPCRSSPISTRSR